MPKVSILVLNFKQAKLTIDCVESLLKQTYKDFEIVIIDNNSEDGSFETFKKEFKNNKKIKVMQTGKNIGYAGGNNYAVKRTNSDYVAILNNDTVVQKDWLEWLVKGFKIDPKVKVVGADMPVVGHKNPKVDSKKVGVTKTLTGYSVFFNRKKPLKDDTFVDQFSVGGCALIYDRSVIDLPFPEEYFIYAEETYFNWLIQLMGYRVIKATKSRGDHFHNIVKKTGGSKINHRFTFLAERNMYINMLIFFSPKNTLKIIPLMILKAILRNLIEVKKIPDHLKAYLWILFHPKYIHEKRKFIRSVRKVSDDIIVNRLSYKIYDPKKMTSFNSLMSFINKFVWVYCWIVRLKTIEFSK
ncbi:glycosyltransferase family 2 protein [archaeon]|nr:glycosyltransferase family 2 protein [archaeon]MBL7057201.1 glycosyltransferase family 2 protein [Candidatus Woesearchaeota archaeon]